MIHEDALLFGGALAGLAALGAVAYSTLLSRRRREEEYLAEQYETAAATASEPNEPYLPDAILPQAQPAVEAAGTPFMMPAGPVPTGAARHELIAQMVAATPDEANPFCSIRARSRRARINLQHREQQLRDAATAPFDWRNYALFEQSGEIDPLPTVPEKDRATV
jgi:hypothetical protein